MGDTEGGRWGQRLRPDEVEGLITGGVHVGIDRRQVDVVMAVARSVEVADRVDPVARVAIGQQLEEETVIAFSP
jgi:hypothetical protein